ncbi:nuclear transport factor 2 family protein [Cupriavidus necator]|uniref:nuclear transport factor 2 family protein n=1 Tax=Cupriavidus necator TaxID=106590 RepID=UPI00059D1E50|nr:nuclear transport factor 2 family protein [Cupriavidus necator]MDX6007664.1 nuclear transport factor 2 family protein [Cupriavidus necator]
MHFYDINLLSTVVYQFFAGLDRRDHACTARLMARNGIWHRQGEELVGPDAVFAALERRDPYRGTGHLVTNLWVEHGSETTARLRYYMTAYETLTGTDGSMSKPKLLGVRDCTDDLVMEDSQWRISCKRSRLMLPSA